MATTGYTSQQLAKVMGGNWLQFTGDRPIEGLSLDSRKITDPSLALFFAVKGKRHDGHRFLGDLYALGVRNFVVTEEEKAYDLPEANVLKVNDSIRALQNLVAWHREQFKLPVIGITGSNGKTIVKEWLYQLLEEDYVIVRSPKSYNSQVGVPLSVWQLNDSHTLGIFEAGISEAGEMEHLQKVIKPDIGIFTNIGEAHSEGFLNNRHKVKEKLKLFIHSRILIYCKDYHEITQAITEIRSQFTDDEVQEKFQLFTWGHKVDADLRITKIESSSNETRIEGVYKEEEIHIVTPFIDKASIENSIHCWATMLYLRVHQEVIQERMRKLGKIAMRLELKDAVNNCSLINDSYNSDLGSLTIALDFLNQQKQHRKKTLILSDILQSGKNEIDLYDDVAALVGQKGVTRLLGIGKAISRQHKTFEKNPNLEVAFYESTDAFLAQLAGLHFNDETILLKGARSFEFERISKLLEQKVHETVLEINLNALAHNLQVYHSLLKPGVKTMVMVKALSYGSGSFEVANTLQFHRADYLGVAYTDEAVTLRKGGITLPIMIMNPEPRSFEAIVQYQLEPDLYNEGIFNKFSEYLQLSGHASAENPFPVHIELDTGMHRLGFGQNEIEGLIKSLKESPWVKVQTIFSHLAASEEAVHDDFTSEQVGRFDHMSTQILKSLDYQPMRHILNSAGIARFPNAQYDMVRLGIGVYGIDTSEALAGKLQQVGRMRTTISQLRTIAAGDTVSYSRTYTASTERRIATVGVGYADGIDRRLSNGTGSMMVHGKLVPIVGRVCMDMCMLDVTDIKDVQEGDEVIVFGPELPVQQVAEWAGTIPYEILTGISARVKRVFWQE